MTPLPTAFPATHPQWSYRRPNIRLHLRGKGAHTPPLPTAGDEHGRVLFEQARQLGAGFSLLAEARCNLQLARVDCSNSKYGILELRIFGKNPYEQ